MEDWAFISRHEPSAEQLAMGKAMGICLVHIGDRDAFSVSPSDIDDAGAFAGVVVVHPAAALRLCQEFRVGVFENANRAPEGERPQFVAKKLHLWDEVD